MQLTGLTSAGFSVNGAAAAYSFDNLAPGTTTIPNLGSLGTAANGLLSGATITAGGGLHGGNVLTIRSNGASGGSYDSMLIPNPIDLSSSTWTLSAWFNGPYTSGGGSGWDCLFQNQAANQWIVINHEHPNGDYGIGAVTNRGGFWWQASPVYDMSNGSVASGWHQLTAVGTNTGGNGTTTFYIDGNLVGSSASAANTNLYCVGNGQGGGSPQPFAQELDDVYVYQRALSATEVASLYQAAFSGANTLPSTSPVNITNGVLDVEGSQIIGPLSGSAAAAVNLGGNLTVNGISNTTFAGVIGGANSLTKVGPNTLTLSGNNTFSGTATVAAGKLMLVGASSALAGPLMINSGAIGGGNGAFSGGITVAGGGLFSVGVPGGPSNVATPSLNLQTGSAVSFKIDPANPANDSDLITTSAFNGLTLGNNISVNLLNMSDGISPYPPNPGDVLNLIQFNGAVQGTDPSVAFRVGNRAALKNYTFGYDPTNTWIAVTITAAPLWTGGSGSDANWSDAGNWTTPPASGQTVAFNGTTPRMTVNNDVGGSSFAGISFGPAPGSYTLSGSGLTMTSDIINFSPSSQTINLPLTVDPSSGGIALNAQAGPIVTTTKGTIDNGGNPLTVSGSSTVTLNGVVSGSGDLTKTGAGTLLLAASNAYTGNTNINAGRVQVSSDSKLGNGGGIVFDGGTLQTVTSGINSPRPVTLNAGNGIIDTNGLNSTFTGQITGVGGLTKIGGGTLTIANSSTTALNSYAGGTTVAQGVLVAGNNAVLGSGPVTLNGATLRLAALPAPAPTGQPLAVSGFTGDDIVEASASSPAAGTNVPNNGYNGWWWYEQGLPSSSQGLPNWAATGGTLSSVYTQPSGGHTLFQFQPYGTTSGGVTTHPSNVAAVPNGGSLTMPLVNPSKVGGLELLYSGQGGGNYNLTLNFADNSTYTFSTNPYLDWTNGATAANPFAYQNAGLVNSGGFYTNQLSLFENDFTVPAIDQSKVLNSVTFNVTSGGGGLMIFALSDNPLVGNEFNNNNLIVNSDSTVDVRNALTGQMGNLTIGNNKLSLTGDSGASLTLGSATLTGSMATFDVQSATTLVLSGAVSGTSGIVKIDLGTMLLSGTASTYSGGTTLNAGVLQINNPAEPGRRHQPPAVQRRDAGGHGRLCRRPPDQSEYPGRHDSSGYGNPGAERGPERLRRTGEVGRRRLDAGPRQ